MRSSSKNIHNVHKQTINRNKIKVLVDTHPSKDIHTVVCLAIAMLKLNLAKPRHQLPAILQNRRDYVINQYNIKQKLFWMWLDLFFSLSHTHMGRQIQLKHSSPKNFGSPLVKSTTKSAHVVQIKPWPDISCREVAEVHLYFWTTCITIGHAPIATKVLLRDRRGSLYPIAFSRTRWWR